MERAFHQPVMLEQALRLLDPRPGGRYVDLTMGSGGHSLRILEQSSPDGIVLGLDRDPQAVQLARRRLSSFGERLRVVHGRFSELPRFLNQLGWEQVDGMLADLGVSSLQLQQPERGFSFQEQGPLDMRMDPGRGEPLSAILDRMDQDSLAEALRCLGEVRSPRLVARRILDARREGQLGGTLQLAGVAVECGRRGGIHPATRVFMALRMMVNRELEELRSLLALLPEPLRIGGRMVFISFHSLEDRLVKQRLRELQGRCTCPPGLPTCACGRRVLMCDLARRAWRPSEQELSENPRARSARMRAAERVAA